MRTISVLDASDAVTLPYPGWQPIETAPTDEGDILLMTRNGLAIGSRERFGGWCAKSEGNLIVTDDAGNLRHVDSPTHWMPLPEPPALQSGAGE